MVPDEVGGARDAVGELLEQGHRRIAFINNYEDYPATRGRLAGYRQALEAYGIPFDPALVVCADPSLSEESYQATSALLSGNINRPTAVFCFNDRMAMGAYQAAAALGLSIPQDVSVIGFDNQVIIAASLRPGLTTMQLPHYQMGHWAVRTLLDRMRTDGAGSVTHALLPCPLVRRASVGPPPRQ